MKRSAVAIVDEARCIGCTRCIDACPVDAISGAEGMMHAVIAEWCTGCELCLPPCPVDCIAMVQPPRPWTRLDATGAVRRATIRRKRISAGANRAAPADRKAVVAAALKRKARP
ncbi:MAG: RnfABCDGE type electron transport complex subunit B [Candidatus Parcubacteria bacterium]|nr:RnfABCDGE type electron transport complex subunit B [Burkholderiales bacterium]